MLQKEQLTDRLRLHAEALRLHSELNLGYVRISKRIGVSANTVSHWLYQKSVPKRQGQYIKGKHLSEERKEQLSQILKGRIPWNKGKHFSAETREKMRLAKLGKPHSGNHNRKIAEANRGKKRSVEFCSRQSERMKGTCLNPKGVPLSEEHRQHISEANKGRVPTWAIGKNRSQETKFKIAVALIGHSVSEKTKQRIRSKRLKQVFPVRDTSIEVVLQEALKRRGVVFRTHVALLGKYQVDIFIKPDVVIECRGDYWHNRQDVRERDQKRDRELSESGYQVFSFWEYEIKADPEECIMKVLNGFEESVDAWRSF